MSYKYEKEALVIVSELVEKGFTFTKGELLKHNSGLCVELYCNCALVFNKKRAVVVSYKTHRSINKVLGLVDGYIALA